MSYLPSIIKIVIYFNIYQEMISLSINLITNTMATKNISLNEKPLFEIEPVYPRDPDYKIFEERSKNAKYITFDELMKSQKRHRKNANK